MVMEYVLFFYMLGMGLVTYFFHEMDEKPAVILTVKIE